MKEIINNYKTNINSILIILMTLLWSTAYNFEPIYDVITYYSTHIAIFILIILLAVNYRTIIQKNKKLIYLLAISIIILGCCAIFKSTGIGSIMQMITLLLILIELPYIYVSKKATQVMKIIIGINFVIYFLCNKSHLNPNYAGYIFLCYYLFFVLTENFKTNKKVKLIIHTVVTLFIAYCIMKTKCRTSMVALCIINVLLILPEKVFLSKWFQYSVPPVTTLGNLIVAFIYVLLWKANFNIHLLSYANKGFYSGRNRIWSEAFSLISKNPILGVGSHYQLQSHFKYALHNLILMITTTFGIPNFLIFLLIFIKFIKNIIEEKLNVINRKRIYLVILTLFFIDFFESYLYWPMFNVLFFVMIIYIVSKNKIQEDENSDPKGKIYFFEEGVDRVGGVERVISTLANEFSKEYKVNVISFYKTRPETFFKYNTDIDITYLSKRKRSKEKQSYKNKIIYYIIRIFEKAKDMTYLAYKIDNVMDKVNKNDIIILGRVDVALKVLPYIGECKKVIVRDAIHLEYQNKKNKKKIAKLFPKKVDLLIVSSDESLKKYKEYIDCEKINIKKIYNPLGITPVQKCSIENKTIISVGRYSYQKGFENLIKAFKIVKEKFPDWKLKIVGNNKDSDILIEQIKILNLENDVILENSKKDVVEELNNSSIFVMTSRYEGYANALVEAMACGLPCISYNWLLGADEIIKDEENGTLVKLKNRYDYAKGIDSNEDIDNLGNAIIDLIEKPQKYNKYMENSAKIIESRDLKLIVSIWMSEMER